jgi:hypothetical protein
VHHIEIILELDSIEDSVGDRQYSIYFALLYVTSHIRQEKVYDLFT